MKQTIGFIIGFCGIICCMCETEYQLMTMLIGFLLLAIGALICLSEVEKNGTY